ncbi:MAG: hypothetical protein A2020_03970 [Lentisphaerae bacterium GWF2_45_14]|nr:MAG: hypothetical protein A2020_03970 [Lentisphaerae bacterium GWF2_45_14]
MKILVVDDSATFRNIIRRKLQSGGYEIIEARDGADALRHIVAAHGTIDLVTLDVEMPVLDGFRTCAELNKEKYRPVFCSPAGGRIPILFVTAQDTIEDRKKGFALGGADFISKEILEDEILTRVDKILKSSKKLAGLKALVADDSKIYLAIISEVLQREGVYVYRAENGNDAYDIISKHSQEIDMVITDLEMPAMNGIELTNKIRKELGLKALPIIILSAIDDKVTQLDLFKSGADDYLTKPFIKEELLARLSVHLEDVLLNRKLQENLVELKKLNNELKISKESIEKQNDERKEMLHVLCHDLVNPFASVIGALELIEVETHFQELKKEAENVAYKGLEIIDLVRKMHAIEDGKTEFTIQDINLNNVLNESFLILKKRFKEKNISTEVNLAPDDRVLAESTSLTNSVINNILTNAIKFSYPGSTIKIYSKKEADGGLRLIIADSGIGMSDKLLKDIFNTNKATSRPGTSGESGTGYGMPLVRKFMNAYGGEIEVESVSEKKSEKEHGTTVTLFFKTSLRAI